MDEICKKCGAKLIKRATQHKPSQLQQAYYYTAYYYCPNCKKLYHSDKFKVVNPQQSLLNEIEPHPDPLLKGEGNTISEYDVKIWTDGACTNNGRENAKAAWAFVSGETERSGLVEWKQTNNVAEALAIYYGLQWAVEKNYKKIRVYSDSQITINNLRKPVSFIKMNRKIFEDIVALIRMHNLQVDYEKVLGHSGDVNNERADNLANTLAGK